MEAKYKCKRCGKIVSIKVPNCPECSSCDGYDVIPNYFTWIQRAKSNIGLMSKKDRKQFKSSDDVNDWAHREYVRHFGEPVKPIPHLKTIDLQSLATVELGGYFTYRHGTMFCKGIRISEAMMVPVGLKCESIESARNQP